ncbi:hypothetical protein JKP88DRAFT_221908, partial [Tribonema minus]
AGLRVGSLVMCAMRAAAAVASLSADMFFECEPHNKPLTLDATVLCTTCHVQAHFRFHTGTLNAQPPEDLVDCRLEVSTINMPFVQTYPAHFIPSCNKSAQTGARSQRDRR